MAQIAALLHRAADMTHEPATKEIKYLLPKPALSLREPRPQQWSNMVQQAWNNVQHITAAASKAQVLGTYARISLKTIKKEKKILLLSNKTNLTDLNTFRNIIEMAVIWFEFLCREKNSGGQRKGWRSYSSLESTRCPFYRLGHSREYLYP